MAAVDMMNVTNASLIPVYVGNTAEVPILTLLSSLFSIVGCFGIFSIIKQQRDNFYTISLLGFLTVADLANALGNFTGAIRYLIKYGGLVTVEEASSACQRDSDVVCIAQSFITTSACMASFWWTFFLTLHHFLLHVVGTSFLENKIWKVIVHVFAWALPGL